MSEPSSPDARQALRQRLLTARRNWAGTPAAALAQEALQARLMPVLAQLEPECLGLYWPLPGEFNPHEAAQAAAGQWDCRLALPFAQKSPVAMHFRAWDGLPPTTRDPCGLPSPEGPPVLPDVLLVPCLGFTAEGWRLGYGGGYFDRFLAAHPGVTAIGVAWDLGLLAASALDPQAHDQPLLAVLTESATWAG